MLRRASRQLIWLITGTSYGLGRDLTLAALRRGDKVIATSRARSFDELADLKAQGADILELDVTAPPEKLHEVAKGPPAAGLYASTKYAVRALAESLDNEIKPLGLRSICFELGYFRTTFLSTDHRGSEKARIADYSEVYEKVLPGLAARNGKQPGDPKKGVEVMLDVVRGEGIAAGKRVPFAVGLGSDYYNIVTDILDAKKRELEEWKEVTYSTDLPPDA
ncbi:uncharacterized protein PHACADRAFT_210230 [Phanerochaete carnosa HHB-10118-sp]|uniref:NAD(P)-binding domain-containing protein n=1 Tax=Phanerochaete carnosa (strain HHB-10118-sp) TaxID=650164 RepID=K5W5L7_PHACS|nr:uncharacterized protein PHACADRAFT_210230 [Phanerochaete carnosa HHB-10118-sp]EKM54430.1 hypothetical protein PHACADRAFT_210230 [Phanerochaete carnosa HHB-10118-sp]